MHPEDQSLCGPGRPSLIPTGAKANREVLLEFVRDARALLKGSYPEDTTRSSGKLYA